MQGNPFLNDHNFGGVPTSTSNPTPMPGGSTAGMNDSFEVDLSDVQEQSYVIPDGKYRAKCLDVSQDVSKSGNPMFVWQFALVGGKYDGREFRSWTAITPAAMWKVAETVIALGVGQNGQVVKFKRGDVIGKECGLVIEKSEYNGNDRSSITKVVPLSELDS